MIKALTFSTLLRAQRNFKQGLKAARGWEADDSDDGGADPDKVVDGSTLLRAFGRADITSLLLHRREWHADRMFDAIEAVQLYTDASPNSGLEFQGMIAQVKKKDGSSYNMTMPGASLAYGLQDCLSKAVTLLWAIWLLCGPLLDDVQYFLNKVTCVTTDSGVEIDTIRMPNILYAFMRWVDGTPFGECGAFVRPNERLLPVAIRVAGWSHAFGNIAKGAAWTWSGFGRKLDLVRPVVRFLKNRTWKNHVKKALRGRTDLDLRPLDRKVSDLAKWRYQTLNDTFRDLNKHRVIMETEFRQEWFMECQEKETLAGVFQASQDAQLWKYMRASRQEVYWPLEKMRHWGMICTCPEHVQMRLEGAKHVFCYFNGCRLDEAFDYTQAKAVEMRTRSRTLTVADCEGDREVHRAVRRMLEYSAAQLHTRNKHYGVPPWSFARCGTRQGAQEFLDMVAKYPIEQHDNTTVNLMHGFGYMLQRFVAGEDMHPALEDAIRVFKTTAHLDESRGEGYHKEPTAEKKRAPASTSKRLKQCTRNRASLRFMQAFKKRYGPRAKDVLRFEWHNYKRILRSAGPRQWQPVGLPHGKFYDRVYREDEHAELNWNSLAPKLPLERPVTHAQPGAADRLNNEYLMALIEPGNHYSVMRQSAPAPGEAMPPREEIHFRVLNTVTSQARPHTMHTVATADDVDAFAAVAFEVQMEHRETDCEAEVAATPGSTAVSYEAEPQWVEPSTITDFENFNKTLQVWRHAEPCASTEGRTLLSEQERAKIRFGVLDDRCPVLAIVQHLRNKGWNAVPAPITHTTSAIGDFDSTEAPRQKRYLQVVCRMEECIRYTSSIPSRQVINFYDCLLRHIPVEPGLKNTEYAVLLNSKRQKDGKLPNVVPLTDEGANEIPDTDQDTFIGALVSPPAPKAAPRAKPVVVASRTGARGSRDPPPSHPSPTVDPVPVCGGDGGGGGVVEPDPVQPPVAVVGGDADSDDEIIGPSHPSVPSRRSGAPKPFSRTCAGLTDLTEITFTDYSTPGGKSYPNYYMTCARCLPAECGRTRGDLPAFRAQSGDIEPLAFLHIWETLDTPPGKKHSRVQPKSKDVLAFAEEHRDELTAMWRELHRRD